LMDHVRRLAGDIGARSPCSEGERRGARYIADQLRAMGLEPSVESFRSVPNFFYTFTCIYIASIVGALLLGTAAALALTALAVLAFWLESNTFPVITPLMPSGRSQNVVARVPLGAAGKTGEDGEKALIVSAHYDSARPLLSFHPRLVSGFRSSYIIMTLSLALNLAAAIATLAAPQSIAWLRWPALAGSAYLLFTALTAWQSLLCWRPVPGANDNASGVAALLGVAAALAQDPPRHTDVWLVATGAEEAGTVGMMRFLAAHRRELEGARVLNLDNVGAGILHYITCEGLLRPFPSDPVLLKAAAAAAGDPDIRAVGRPYRALTTDAICAMARGYPAMGIMALDGGVPRNWHWPSDTCDAIDPAVVTGASRLALGVIRRLDKAETG